MSYELMPDDSGPAFRCQDCLGLHPLADVRLLIGDGRTRQRCPTCHDAAVRDVYGGNVQPITVQELENDARLINQPVVPAER